MITMEAIKSSIQAVKDLDDDLRNRLLSDLEKVFITNPPSDLALAIDALNKIAQKLPDSSAKKLIYQKIKELADEIIQQIELEEMVEKVIQEMGDNERARQKTQGDDIIL
ncbi:hypothetical protein [Streptococcus porcorum]|uniref:Uncharacterized protein n=1 Tax=Streptococcus porcorum TaxID=701526 RepID=A0ABV2JCS9_9STRE